MLIFAALSAYSVKNGARVVNVKSVMFHYVLFELVEIIAAYVKKLFADGAFKMKMLFALAFAVVSRILKAGALAGRSDVFPYFSADGKLFELSLYRGG